MIRYLIEDEIVSLAESADGQKEDFGILFEDGECVDCISMEEALSLQEEHGGGEIYTYES